jgi:hypothetical protein
MIARNNRVTILAIFALLMGFIIVSSAGCPAGDDDNSASDDDDSTSPLLNERPVIVCVPRRGRSFLAPDNGYLRED